MAWLRRVPIERLVAARRIVIVDVLFQDLGQVSLAHDDDVVCALTADRADHALDEWILVRLVRHTVLPGPKPGRRHSLQPEALGADQEATNGLKHSEKRPLRGSASRAGRSASEHRAGPERCNRGSRSTQNMEKADVPEDESEKLVRASRRGSGGSTLDTKDRVQQGKSASVGHGGAVIPTVVPRGHGLAGADGGWVRSTAEAGQLPRREGTLVVIRRWTRQERGDWR